MNNWGHPLLCLACVCGWLMGCDRADSPACLQTAGTTSSRTVVLEADFIEVVEVYGHLDVSVSASTGDSLELTWTGPANWLDRATETGDEGRLILGFEDRCNALSDLSEVMGLSIAFPLTSPVPKLELHGQGGCVVSLADSAAVIQIDAFAYAGTIEVQAEVDSLRIRLHAGVALTEVQGWTDTSELFASGLSRLDASGLNSQEAYINQSGIQPLKFRASDYAYITIESAGDVYGGLVPPTFYVLERSGSGNLHWE
jgi:hypothetical protein